MLTPAGERHCGFTMAADASGVYWSQLDPVNPSSGSVRHVALGGGTATSLASDLTYRAA